MDIHVRWMIRRDLPEVLAIERAAFATPWSEQEILSVLRQRNAIGSVATEVGPGGAERRVLGFMVYMRFPDRLLLLNLAVRADARRQGVGRALAAKLAGKLHPERMRRASILVRERNDDAILFFRDAGFVAAGVERERFDDTGEDGYLMVYTAAAPARLPLTRRTTR